MTPSPMTDDAAGIVRRLVLVREYLFDVPDHTLNHMESVTDGIALIERLSEQLAERQVEASDYKLRAQMNADAIQHYADKLLKANERLAERDAELAEERKHAEAMADALRLVCIVTNRPASTNDDLVRCARTVAAYRAYRGTHG